LTEPETTDPRRPRPRIDRIQRAIKRARKLSGPEFDENPEQVRFMLEEARILATLEVADALRGGPDADA
jgi:hypothetical protein